jgi:hypothetical protein
MYSPAAIIIGAVLIAGVILLTNHYEITPAPDRSETVMRLNRWTGEIDVCAKDGKTTSGSSAGGVTCEHR